MIADDPNYASTHARLAAYVRRRENAESGSPQEHGAGGSKAAGEEVSLC